MKKSTECLTSEEVMPFKMTMGGSVQLKDIEDETNEEGLNLVAHRYQTRLEREFANYF